MYSHHTLLVETSCSEEKGSCTHGVYSYPLQAFENLILVQLRLLTCWFPFWFISSQLPPVCEIYGFRTQPRQTIHASETIPCLASLMALKRHPSNYGGAASAQALNSNTKQKQSCQERFQSLGRFEMPRWICSELDSDLGHL